MMGADGARRIRVKRWLRSHSKTARVSVNAQTLAALLNCYGAVHDQAPLAAVYDDLGKQRKRSRGPLTPTQREVVSVMRKMPHISRLYHRIWGENSVAPIGGDRTFVVNERTFGSLYEKKVVKYVRRFTDAGGLTVCVYRLADAWL